MTRKTDSLQALRAIAALWIFASHAHLGAVQIWAVAVFFMLSGFLMMYNYRDREDICGFSVKDCVKFSAGKIKKLYLLHLVTTFAALLLAVYEARSYINAEVFATLLKKLALNILLVQSWVPIKGWPNALNGVSWYLSTAAFLYFVFPYIFRLFRKHGSLTLAWTLIGALFVLEYAFGGISRLLARPVSFVFEGASDMDVYAVFNYEFPLFRLIDFSIGCAFGYIFTHREQAMKTTRFAYRLDALCVFFYGFALWFYNNVVPSTSQVLELRNLVFSMVALLLLAVFAIDRGFISRVLTNRLTVAFGGLSAYFYLIHELIIRGCMTLLAERGFAFELTLYITVPLSFVLSVLLSMGWKKLFAGRARLRA